MKIVNKANFETTGSWIIPMILGWSKSKVILYSKPIGIMFTIHITPFFNIGINNPKPKTKPVKQKIGRDCECEECGCYGDDFEKWLTSEMEQNINKQRQNYNPFVIALSDFENFVLDSNPWQVLTAYPTTKDGITTFLFIVSGLDVFIPEDFNGYRTQKFVGSPKLTYGDEHR